MVVKPKTWSNVKKNYSIIPTAYKLKEKSGREFLKIIDLYKFHVFEFICILV